MESKPRTGSDWWAHSFEIAAQEKRRARAEANQFRNRVAKRRRAKQLAKQQRKKS